MISLSRFTRFLRGRSPRSPAGAAAASPPAARPLPYSRLTLDDWRSSPERVAYVESLLRDPTFLALIGMLAGARPFQGDSLALNPTNAAYLLGVRTGYDQLIASLLKAGVSPFTPPADVPADYGAINALAAWDKEGDAS